MNESTSVCQPCHKGTPELAGVPCLSPNQCWDRLASYVGGGGIWTMVFCFLYIYKLVSFKDKNKEFCVVEHQQIMNFVFYEIALFFTKILQMYAFDE